MGRCLWRRFEPTGDRPPLECGCDFSVAHELITEGELMHGLPRDTITASITSGTKGLFVAFSSRPVEFSLSLRRELRL